MTSEEVAELSERADVAAVRRYRSAVGVHPRVVQVLPASAWDEVLSLEDSTRAAAVGAFGPNDDWIEGGPPPRQGHTRGHQMGQTAIRHNTAHIGEGVTIRGLGGFGLGG